MSASQRYESTGRTTQKMRTRKALVEAARALIAGGETPTVEQSADAASISRTTAYRYFPNQRDLLIAAYPEMDLRSLMGEYPPQAIEARLDAVLNEFLRITIENESGLRAALRLSLEPQGEHKEKLLMRQGRAIAWMREALESLNGQLSEKSVERLIYAIRATAGIEALVWLCDIAGLSRDEAKEIMMWAAQGLLRTTLAEAGLKSTGNISENTSENEME